MKHRLTYIILALMIAATAFVPSIVFAQDDGQELEQELIRLLEEGNIEEATQLLAEIEQPDSVPPEEIDDGRDESVMVVDIKAEGLDLNVALAWNPEIDQPQSARFTVEDATGEAVFQDQIQLQQDDVSPEDDTLPKHDGIEIISLSAALESVPERGLQYHIVITGDEGEELARYPYRVMIICDDEENCAYEVLGGIFTEALLITAEMDKALDEVEEENPEDIIATLLERYPDLRGEIYALGLEIAIQQGTEPATARSVTTGCICWWTAIVNRTPPTSSYFSISPTPTTYKAGWVGPGAAHYFAAKSVSGSVWHSSYGKTQLTMKMRCWGTIGWMFKVIPIWTPHGILLIKIAIPILGYCQSQCDGEVTHHIRYLGHTTAEKTGNAVGYARDWAGYTVDMSPFIFTKFTSSLVFGSPFIQNDSDWSLPPISPLPNTRPEPSTATLETHGFVWAWADSSNQSSACAKVVNDFTMSATATASCTIPNTVSSSVFNPPYLWWDLRYNYLDRVVCDRPLRGTSDLGDAPDSTNHDGVGMTTYPTPIPARFPTVYGVTAPDVPGPIHWNPREDAWLGPEVTLENDADIPPDDDTNTNIIPLTNTPDEDGADDGVRLDTVRLPQCGQTTFDYDVEIVGPVQPRYVNVWFDYNRDGDWEDILRCQTTQGNVIQVVEWSVRNEVFTLGAGTHTLTTPSFAAMRSPTPDDPTWMRITLGESPVSTGNFQIAQPSDVSGVPVPDRPLVTVVLTSTIQLPDGRGPVNGYEYGETEDYYLDVERPPNGEIHGMKWLDSNNDGIKDPGEPGLVGWTISIQNGAGTAISTTTDSDGNYWFMDLAPGTYYVVETQQPSWVQTYPATVHQTVTVQAGQIFEDINFGNTEPCKKPERDRCVAGRADKFKTSDGPEPSTPGPDLLALAAARGWNVLNEFDVVPGDRFFMHTFGASSTDTCLSDACLITGAKLTLKLRAGQSSLVSNDTLHFVEDGVIIWGASIASLASGGTWLPGDTETITLDLANLPVAWNGVTNVLAALQDGDFDLFIQDDTGVDYLELDVEKCCCEPFSQVYLAGEMDDFDPDPDVPPATPSSGLSTLMTVRARDFDQAGRDYHFGHTFTDLIPDEGANTICHAELEIRIRPEGRGLVYNDTIGLFFVDNSGIRQDAWGRYIGSDNPSPGLLNYRWGTGNSGLPETIVLDLSALPMPDGSTRNFLSQLNKYGFLDVFSQDDTAVDYVKLTLGYCCDGKLCGYKFDDTNGNGVWDNSESGLEDWLIQIEDGNGDITTATTDKNGCYCFAPLKKGAYTVSEDVQSGWVQTFPGGAGTHTTTINQQSDIQNIDFGNQKIPFHGEIHGTKWLDSNGNGIQDAGEPNLPGWTILLENEAGTVISTTTDAEGYYWFMNLPTGTYTVAEVIQPGWTQTFPMQGVHNVTLDVDQVKEDVNFGNRDGDGDWCKTGWDVNAYNSDVTKLEVAMTIYNQSGANANYQVNVIGYPGFVVNGFYTTLPPSPTPVTPIPVPSMGSRYIGIFMSPLPTFIGPSGQYQVIVTNVSTGHSFGCTAQLWQNDLLGVQPVGNELAEGLVAGVAEMIDFELHNLADRDLVVELDFEPMFGINGRELDVLKLNDGPSKVEIPAGEMVVVSVQAELIEPVPDGGGDVILFADVNGDGQPDVASSVIVFMEEPDQDSGISGTKWNDVDQDGIQDAGEPGIPGATVTLQAPDGTTIATTTTDEEGNYSFTGLEPGKYIVVCEPPEGMNLTKRDVGDDDTVDSEFDPETGSTDIITVPAGDTIDDIDAGLITKIETKPGDVGCDGIIDVVDALFILQGDIGLREWTDQCPIARRENMAYLPACDVDGDDTCSSVDALYILQCDVGITNPLCPDENVFSSQVEDSTTQIMSTSHLDIPATTTGSRFTATVQATGDNLGAITAIVSYDPDHYRVVVCHSISEGGSFGDCNRTFDKGKVRFNIVIPSGISGTVSIADIGFERVGNDVGSTLETETITITDPDGKLSDAELRIEIEDVPFLLSKHWIYLPTIQK